MHDIGDSVDASNALCIVGLLTRELANVSAASPTRDKNRLRCLVSMLLPYLREFSGVDAIQVDGITTQRVGAVRPRIYTLCELEQHLQQLVAERTSTLSADQLPLPGVFAGDEGVEIGWDPYRPQ